MYMYIRIYVCVKRDYKSCLKITPVKIAISYNLDKLGVNIIT